MTKFFSASEKKLLKRYNRRIFLINILPISIALTLFAVVFLSKNSAQPISYYYGVIIILTITVGYSFITVLVGSLIMSRRLKYNKMHTYVQILNTDLIVSRYIQVLMQGKETIIYKKIWLLKLSEIQDIYYYKRNIIVIAPTRLIHQQADWLTYTHNRNGVKFDNWWYDINGAKLVGGVEIHDMFTSPKRIARSIQNASGKMQQKDAESKNFKERMLKIARSSK